MHNPKLKLRKYIISSIKVTKILRKKFNRNIRCVQWELCIICKPKYIYGNFRIQLRIFNAQASRKQRAAALKWRERHLPYLNQLYPQAQNPDRAPACDLCPKRKKRTVRIQQARVLESYEKHGFLSVPSWSTHGINVDQTSGVYRERKRAGLFAVTIVRAQSDGKAHKSTDPSFRRQGDQNLCRRSELSEYCSKDQSLLAWIRTLIGK